MNEEFKNKLIGAEPENSALRAEYERKLNTMLFEAPIPWYRKAGTVFAMLVCAVTVVIAGTIAYRFRHGPSIVLAGMALGGVFGIAGLVLLSGILARGTYRLGRDSVVQAGLIYGFIVLLDVLFMTAGGISTVPAVGLNVIGLFFLIGAGFILLRSVIEQSELRTREKLLELEYQLAQMKELLQKK